MPPPLVDVVTVHLPKPARVCFELFCDVPVLATWVPGLRRARTLTTTRENRPRDVKFEFGESRTYSLVYSYDTIDLRISFVPGMGERDAVTGWAHFVDDAAGGSTMTYALDPGAARTEIEREAGDARHLADAFARWVTSTRP